jgi:hypothetical protein
MRFDEFSNQTDTTIEFQRVTDTEAKIEIRGEFEKAEKARMLCLVYLDELVSYLAKNRTNSIGWTCRVPDICPF